MSASAPLTLPLGLSVDWPYTQMSAQQQESLLGPRRSSADYVVSPLESDSDESTHRENATGNDPDEHPLQQEAGNIAVSNDDPKQASVQALPPRRSSSASQRDRPDSDEIAQESAITHKGQDIDATHFWWYWDFAGAAVAVICMVLIAVALFEADGKPLDSWPVRISLNTIIAILTTVARTALLVPLGSSISQLKWRHITLKARPLEHLQIFDGASRGPWGSLMMIRHPSLIIQSKLTCALALATILTLGISPSAQQILEYDNLPKELPHLNVAIGRADDYFSKGFRQLPYQTWQKRDPNEDLPAFQSRILQALAGTSSQPQFDCPAEARSCEWADFSTLAVCRTFRNVTDQTDRDCFPSGDPAQICNYTIPLGEDRLGEDSRYNISMAYFDHNANTNEPRASAVLKTAFIPAGQPDGWIGQLIVLRHSGEKWEEKGGWGLSVSNPTTPEVFLANFRWCRKVFRGVIATNGVLETNDEGVEETFLESGSPILTDRYNPYDANSFKTPDGRKEYKLTRTLTADLPTYLASLLESEYGERPGSRATNEAIPDSPIQMQHLLYRADIANLTRNLEAVLTDQARSSDPGDNRNATLFTEGRAFGDTTYIRVRWEWFALPVVVVMLSLGLFVTTVVVNSTRKTPLLKDSLLALLFYPLRGWTEGEVYVNGVQTGEKLQKLAGGLRGRLETDEGRYRIMRNETAVKE